ncbi:MAG: DUF47 family protein [Elusimicrobiota bacterium]
MAFTLIPRDEKFLDLFDEAVANLTKAGALFHEMLSSWTVNDPRVSKIRELEHEGDITTHEIFDRLNRTFITPFDREDIHELGKEIDDVADLIQSASERLRLYRIDKIEKDLIEQAEILNHAILMMAKAVTGLRNLKEPRRIIEYCIEINRLENGGDRVMERALSDLFSNHKDPMMVIKWKEIYEIAETAIDKCEDVANVIETIIVKQG